MVPMPAPLPLVEALQSVQVNSQRDRTGFQLTFTVGKTSPLQTLLLPSGLFDPMVTRVVIIVTYRGLPQVLFDGVVTRQEVSPSNEPGQSTLTLTGEDLSVLMDVIEVKVPYPGHAGRRPDQPDPRQVRDVRHHAARHSAPRGHREEPHRRHRCTNRHRPAIHQGNRVPSGLRLLHRAGTGAAQNIAYFGPDVNVPIPQPALSVNWTGTRTSSRSASAWTACPRSIVVMTILDPDHAQDSHPDARAEHQHPEAAARRPPDAARQGAVP